MSSLKLTILCLLSTPLLFACALQPLSLEGSWKYHQQDGSSVVVNIKDFPKEKYYLDQGDLQLSGVYMKKDSLLIMEKGNDPRLIGFELEIITKNKLRVIKEPPVRLTNKRHLGSDLVRIDEGSSD